MKNSLIFLFLFSITFLIVSCNSSDSGKKVIKIKEVSLKIAKEDVQRFYHTYPDSAGCDSNGKNCKYAVSSVYTVYSVKFTKNDSIGLSIKEAYPEYDFKEIIEKFPNHSDGVRIYEAIGDSTFLNYVVYTEPNNSNKPSNDILDKIYCITNHKFDLRIFTEGRGGKQGSINFFNNHLSCVPDCPSISLLTQ